VLIAEQRRNGHDQQHSDSHHGPEVRENDGRVHVSTVPCGT
jgi:hypothetical protein